MTIDERIAALPVNIESLHASVHEVVRRYQQNSQAIRENSPHREIHDRRSMSAAGRIGISKRRLATVAARCRASRRLLR
jgi:hypothetical protein